MKIGIGYDVHKLVENRDLIIGGVLIPYDKGLLGHSDADVLTHSVIDAILGALGLGDIGTHFPDSNDLYKNINSLSLLDSVYNMMLKEGYTVGNIDSVIVAQKPKMIFYVDDMKNNLSNCLCCSSKLINIKGKTEEGLGFTGAGQGIAAKTVCILNKV